MQISGTKFLFSGFGCDLLDVHEKKIWKKLGYPRAEFTCKIPKIYFLWLYELI